MPVAVAIPNRPPEQKDPLDTILKGLDIASKVYGIKSDIDEKGLKEKQKQRDEQLFRFNMAKEGLIEDKNRPGYYVEDPNSSITQQRKNKAQIDYQMMTLMGLKPDQFNREVSLREQQEKNRIENLEKDRLLREKQLIESTRLREKELQIKKGGGASSGKMLPAGEASKYGEANAIIGSLEKLKQSIQSNNDIIGPAAGRAYGLAGFLELGESGKRLKSLKADLGMNAQNAGRYLEGGKLTDADMKRYKDEMLATVYDSSDLGVQKIDSLIEKIKQKRDAEIMALGQAGFNVKSMSQPKIEMKKTITPEQQQAIQWLKTQDPKNEKAIRVRQKLIKEGAL
jgi:hypothetical protein